MSDDPHRISLDKAVELTAAHRKRHPNALKGWGFPRHVLEALLKEPGMAGIRIYAAEQHGEATVVVVATDAEGRDLVQGYIAEEAMPCPPTCDRGSPLQGPDRE